MSPRPAPQYGEYATPEEVREALGQPDAPKAEHRIADAQVTVAGTAGLPHDGQPAGQATAPGAAAAPTDPRLSSAHRWDQLVTVALLVMGMWNVIFGTPGMLSFDQSMRSYFAEVQGMPDATFGEPTRIIGQIMAAAFIIVLVASMWFSWRRLRAAKFAFWVPLVGAAVAVLVMIAGVVAMLAFEPGLYDAIASLAVTPTVTPTSTA